MIGDHIRALREGRWTHGIDCGDQTIIHVEADAAPGNRVQRSYRPTFEAGASAVEVVSHRERVYAPKAVVARAFAPIRDPALAAMFRDSEAFACWCKTGRLPAGPRNRALMVQGVARANAGRRAAAPKKAVTTQSRRAAEKAKPRRAAAAKKVTAAKKSAAGRKARAGKAAPRRAAGQKKTGRKAAARTPTRRSAKRRGR